LRNGNFDRIQDISRAERVAFNIEEKTTRSRTGILGSLAIADMGLATVIGKSNRDASGHLLDAEMRAIMQRLRTWDLRTHSHSPVDRNLIKAFGELNIIRDRLALSEAVVEKAAYIYRRVQDRGLIRGRTISGIMAAAIMLHAEKLEPPTH
jgi:transcription initiation factor TFIIB